MKTKDNDRSVIAMPGGMIHHHANALNAPNAFAE
jgi:hypothetical protein